MNEVTNGQTTKNLFGGGYDLILHDGSEFRTFSEVSFLLVSHAMSHFKNVTGPINFDAPILIKLGYADDFPVIRAVIPKNQLGIKSDKNERTMIVPLITARPENQSLTRKYDWAEFPLISKFLMVIVLGIGPKGTVEHFVAAVRDEEALQFEVRPSPSPNKVQFLIPKNIMNNIFDAAQAMFNRKADGRSSNSSK